MLMIKGNELHVSRLTLEKGEVDIDGRIDSFTYSDAAGVGYGKKNTFQERRTFSRKEERLSRKKSSYENGRALFCQNKKISPAIGKISVAREIFLFTSALASELPDTEAAPLAPGCRSPCTAYREQVKGIEPSCSAWEADILPLNYTCASWNSYLLYHRLKHNARKIFGGIEIKISRDKYRKIQILLLCIISHFTFSSRNPCAATGARVSLLSRYTQKYTFLSIYTVVSLSKQKNLRLDPRGTVNFCGVKTPVILCHQDSYRIGLGGNHGDAHTCSGPKLQ